MTLTQNEAARKRSKPHPIGFLAFGDSVVDQMNATGHPRTAEHYRTSLNSFRRFTDQKDVDIDKLDAALIMEYETHLRNRNLCPNSISFYMRTLRAIYNRAVETDIVVQRLPFRRVYTGVDRTKKRAIPHTALHNLRQADLSASPVTAFARDIFMFSFFTRGMSLIDIAYLRKTDIQGSTLAYRRRKTGQRITVRWEPAMQEIVDLHSDPDSPFMLPLITDPDGDMHRQFLSAAQRINRHLKKIGKSLGLVETLTSYVARHTWASLARTFNIPLSVISEAMGHNSEKTTRIYLTSLDTSEVDKANSKIINLV